MNWQTSCPDDQRRKKPTQEQLISRIYRHVLEIEKRQRQIVEPLANHCQRLLNEKETLMRMFDYKDSDDFQRQWHEANAYMAKGVKPYADQGVGEKSSLKPPVFVWKDETELKAWY